MQIVRQGCSTTDLKAKYGLNPSTKWLAGEPSVIKKIWNILWAVSRLAVRIFDNRAVLIPPNKRTHRWLVGKLTNCHKTLVREVRDFLYLQRSDRRNHCHFLSKCVDYRGLLYKPKQIQLLVWENRDWPSTAFNQNHSVSWKNLNVFWRSFSLKQSWNANSVDWESLVISRTICGR